MVIVDRPTKEKTNIQTEKSTTVNNQENISLIILWVIVVGLLILLIVLSACAMYNYRNSFNIIIEKNIQMCESVSDLPNVKNLKCCVVSGELTANKFYDKLNLVINPVPTYYLDVCKGFCINGYNFVDNNCIGGIGDEDFLKCVNASEPKDCYGISLPVATSGNDPYYVNSATDATCKERRDC